MSGRSQESAESLIVVARALRTRGLKGEIVAESLTDFPQRFDSPTRLFGISPDGERKALLLLDGFFQKGRVILRFADYDTVEAAQTLVGYDFAVPEAQRLQLPEGTFYNWELEGCRVHTFDGTVIGDVREVLATGGVEMLVVRDSDREYLIPMAESIVKTVDIPHKKICIDPPEGLLDL